MYFCIDNKYTNVYTDIIRQDKLFDNIREREANMEDMGMTDNQYKDFVEGIKEDLEELNEYKETKDDARYNKKYKRLMDRLEKALKR